MQARRRSHLQSALAIAGLVTATAGLQPPQADDHPESQLEVLEAEGKPRGLETIS